MSGKAKTVCGPARYALLALGCAATAVGIAGIVLPGVPGTVFLLVAVWAFSKSSERFHLWLYNHPTFGAGIRRWHEHRVIPTRAKIAAVTAIASSYLILCIAIFEHWEQMAGTGLVLALVAGWIVTRRGRLPAGETA